MLLPFYKHSQHACLRFLHLTQIDWPSSRASAAFCSSHLLEVDSDLCSWPNFVVCMKTGETSHVRNSLIEDTLPLSSHFHPRSQSSVPSVHHLFVYEVIYRFQPCDSMEAINSREH